jgi:hypothetical protein
MKQEEKHFLKQKWVFQKFQTYGNGGLMKIGLEVLDFRKDDVITVEDGKGGKAEFNYTLGDKTLDLYFPVHPKNILRLRIIEVTSDKLKIALSGRRGDEKDDKFGQEFIELHYSPTLET